jgi:hypothetical protein
VLLMRFLRLPIVRKLLIPCVMVSALVLSLVPMFGLSIAPASAATGPLVVAKGDLAVSLLSGEVDEYTPSGTFVQKLMGSSDGLGLPTGSAFDGNGNLYVTDFSKNQILRRDALTGAVTVFASNTSLGNGQTFNSPESIVFNRGYTQMLVSGANRDGSGGGINVVDVATGAGVSFYPLHSSSGSEGSGESDWLAFDANSNLFMTNENPAQGVMKVDTGTGDVVLPPFAPNLPNDGYALSFDKSGNLWLGDTNSILEYNSQGTLLNTISNPGFSTIFAAVFNGTGDQFYAGDINTGTVYTYDLSGNLMSSFNAGTGVSGLSVAGVAVPPNTNTAQNFTVAPGNEPTITVDPTNPDHIVVGYNHGTFAGTRCSWSQTTDGGKSWTSGLLPGFAHSNWGTDPTVRFDSSGHLYYTCLVIGSWSAGLHAHQRLSEVAMYRSDTGFASQFSGSPTVVTSKQQTCPYGDIPVCNQKLPVPPLDHPGLALAHDPASNSQSSATLPVVCWTQIDGRSGNSTVLTEAFTPDLQPEGSQAVGNGGLCFMSGPPNMVSVSLQDVSGTFLALKTSFDGGADWSQVVTFNTPGLLLGDDTVTNLVSTPYVLAAPDGAGTIRAIVSDRANGKGRVYVADASRGFALTATLSQNGSESFLSGAGDCVNTIGAYERTSTGYGYTIWERDGSSYQPAYSTPKDMTGGYADPRFGNDVTRIGDYTDAGCLDGTAWVAYTDSHNNGDLTIHVARLAGS